MALTRAPLRVTEVPVFRGKNAGLTAWMPQPSNRKIFYFLAGVTSFIAIGIYFNEMWFRPSTISPVVVLGGIFLTYRSYLTLCGLVITCGILVVVSLDRAPWQPGVVAPMLVLMALMGFLSKSRDSLGLSSFDPPRMLRDLRDRLLSLGAVPDLPAAWGAEVEVCSAEGAGFSGDFVITHLSEGSTLLEVVLVDVSGKGQAAGTRSLQLSGAMGGLLGSVSPEEFLPSANRYLLRQNWDGGFASAVYIALDVSSGEYRLASAGHPPALQRASSEGAWWPTVGGAGPVLGVFEDPYFEMATGTIQAGGGVILYTDGVVESRGHRLDEGITWALHVVEEAGTELAGLARQLCDEGRAGAADDRGVVTLWRTAG